MIEEDDKATKARIIDIIKDWPDFSLPEYEDDNQHLSIEVLLGQLEIISGQVLIYTAEKEKRREKEELQRIYEESEAHSQKFGLPDNDEDRVFTSAKDIILGNEKLLDQIELDEPEDSMPSKAKKQKILDLIKLRRHNMNLFDDNLSSAVRSNFMTVRTGKSSHGNMSTTLNLNSGAASRNRVTDKFDFTGFTIKKGNLIKKLKT